MDVLVCDTYHGNIQRTQPEAGEVQNVVLTRDEVRRSRVRATTDSGTEVGVAVDRRLRDGDIVHDGEVAVVVALEPIEAFAVKLDDMCLEQATVLGHDLGNAHHEMAVEEGVSYVPANEETRQRLGELPDGVSVDTVDVEPSVFDGDSEKTEHGDSHSHGDGHQDVSHSHTEQTAETGDGRWS